MNFIMKIAAYERAKYVGKHTAGGAVLGAALGAGGAALAGKDWKNGAVGGALGGAALGGGVGYHKAKKHTNVGRGLNEENHWDREHESADDSFKRGREYAQKIRQSVNSASRDLGRNAIKESKPGNRMESIRDAYNAHQENMAMSTGRLKYLERLGKGKSRIHAMTMGGHNSHRFNPE